MITSHYPNVPVYTSTPPTAMARRDALSRELVTPVQTMEKAATDKPVVTDEKNRNTYTPQNSSQPDAATERGQETSKAVEGREQEPHSERDGRQQQQQQAEQQEIQELKSRDLEVRQHEQAHAAVGGQYAAAPSYEYETGPDGKRYATGGEVSISVSEIPGDPQATISKMQQVKAAALAPAEPSSADRQIAADATRKMVQAQSELMKQRSSVIAGFYQRATEPQTKQYLQQA